VKALDLTVYENLRLENIQKMSRAKEKGARIIGSYCTYCPRELILAAGAIPLGLCGTREVPDEIEMPRNLCPMIKASYGLAVSNKCPYFALSDMVIGETTCDGKKKMFEVLKSKGIKDVYVMHLPQMPDTKAALALWLEELRKLKAYLEKQLGVTITDAALREAIHITNEESRARQRLFDLNKRKPAVLSGMDMLNISYQVTFMADPLESIRLIDSLAAELEAADSQGEQETPIKRILLTGTPVGVGSEKIIRLVEECGANVVVMENCGGYKTLGLRIDEIDRSDPLLLMAQRYLQIPCSVMSPNQGRLDLLKTMVRDFQVDGVLDLTWQACHTYNIESYFVADMVKSEIGLPFLQLETDYSESDVETLRVRIEAFLEMIK
jgi:benzoyl-CoA reductase/2-hydroxyglutaryl-CoA dehydratase subunit BcrC/BadD/HgdB